MNFWWWFNKRYICTLINSHKSCYNLGVVILDLFPMYYFQQIRWILIISTIFWACFFYYSCVNCTKWTCPKLLLCVTVEQEKNFNLNNLLIMKQWSGSTVQKPTNRIWIFGVASWSNTFKKCGITSLPITDACVLSSTSCWSRDYQEAGALLYI